MYLLEGMMQPEVATDDDGRGARAPADRGPAEEIMKPSWPATKRVAGALSVLRLHRLLIGGDQEIDGVAHVKQPGSPPSLASLPEDRSRRDDGSVCCFLDRSVATKR